jgi:hypothetical protein
MTMENVIKMSVDKFNNILKDYHKENKLYDDDYSPY